jgi:hypothetical protein
LLRINIQRKNKLAHLKFRLCRNPAEILAHKKQALLGSYFFNKAKCSKRIAAKHAAELDEPIELNSIDFIFSQKISSSLSTMILGNLNNSCIKKCTTLDLLY